MNPSEDLHPLKELAIRAQIPEAETDKVVRIITVQDDPTKPNLGRSAEDMETVRQFRDRLAQANVFNTPI